MLLAALLARFLARLGVGGLFRRVALALAVSAAAEAVLGPLWGAVAATLAVFAAIVSWAAD